jgi:hypothetical protein
MRIPFLLPSFLAGVLAASLLLPALARPFQDDGAAGAADMAAMMEKARRYTEPGEHHELLQRFLGRWETEARFFMGGEATPPEKGTAEISWLMEGRWLQNRVKGTFLGLPMEEFTVMGYDNFKQSYVATAVGSFDTAMRHAEGDLDPGGKVLLLYGTLDEYLTGEHDKMVKLVYRFVSDDEIVLEIHDLPIGETNTKVVEVHYRRKTS